MKIKQLKHLLLAATAVGILAGCGEKKSEPAAGEPGAGEQVKIAMVVKSLNNVDKFGLPGIVRSAAA